MSSSLVQRLKSSARFGLLVTLVLLTSGCASFNRIAEYPAPNQPATVAVVSKPMSKMTELPLGVYYDEPRQIIVTGHQKGLFAGMMFGLVGVMVADQMNKSSGSAKYADDSAQSGTDLGTLTRELLATTLGSDQAPHWSLAADKPGLRLTPYAVFTVEKSGGSRLYAMLRAEIIGPDGSPTWSARYFARAPGIHPLDGEDTWMKGTRFHDGMRAALARTLAVCADDTHGRLTGKNHLLAKGYYPYLNIELELPAIVVQETPDYLVARLVIGDAMVLAGTHVLDRADYTVKPGTFKDPRSR